MSANAASVTRLWDAKSRVGEVLMAHEVSDARLACWDNTSNKLDEFCEWQVVCNTYVQHFRSELHAVKSQLALLIAVYLVLVITLSTSEASPEKRLEDLSATRSAQDRVKSLMRSTRSLLFVL